MGKELKSRLLEAGFSNVRTSASFDFFGSAEDVAFLHAFIIDWFYSPRVIEAATSFGLATHQQFDQWRQGLDEWRDSEGACGAFAFGEVIASKPEA